MSTELLAILATVAGVGFAGTVTTISVVVGALRAMRRDITGLSERLARVEGMIDTLQSVMLADRGRRSDSATDEGTAA